MISKNKLKYYSSLLQKKYRESEKKFIAEGKKIVEEGLNSNYKCELIFISNDFEKREKDFLKKLNNKNINPEIINSIEFNKISDTKSPQGIAAVFHSEMELKDFSKIDSELIVGLENINDPGNLGTILRTCDWFNIKDILISKDSVEIFNPKVIRSSMGSIFHLNIYFGVDFEKDIKSFAEKRYKFVCADIKGKNIYDFDFPQKTILFFCNEASGPSKNLLNIIDDRICIPKYGQAESLNVSSAFAAILSEFKRKIGNR